MLGPATGDAQLEITKRPQQRIQRHARCDARRVSSG
jgi:hypothetical protein